MARTLQVRGQGGWVFEVDVPPLGSIARENFDNAIARHELAVIGEVEVEEFDEEVAPGKTVRRRVVTPVGGVPSKAAEVAEAVMPGPDDPKAAWVAWAVAQGASVDAARRQSKESLIANYGQE